jgi:hypothetical protein
VPFAACCESSIWKLTKMTLRFKVLLSLLKMMRRHLLKEDLYLLEGLINYSGKI